MIYLITGKPGEGKTLYALKWVHDLAKRENRPVFYARVRGLQERGVLPWQQIDPFKWYEAPPRSIVLIDEIQKAADPNDPKSPTLFGVRKRGDPVPLWASKLEDHRHGGVDLVLITQDPMLMDSHDRKLVGTHWHVKRNFGFARATIHEFKGCRPNVDASVKGSVATYQWAYPKEVYGWYESAEAHTHKPRLPMKMVLLFSMPFIIGGIGWASWHYYLDPDRKKSPESQPAMAGGTRPAQAPARQPAQPYMTTEQYLEQHAPRIKGLAYTAPIYDKVTAPTRAPYPAGCVSVPPPRNECTCYTSQGTRLEMDATLCHTIVKNGFFTAWDEQKQPPPVPAMPAPPAPERPNIASLGSGRPMGPAGGPVDSAPTEAPKAKP